MPHRCPVDCRRAAGLSHLKESKSLVHLGLDLRRNKVQDEGAHRLVDVCRVCVAPQRIRSTCASRVPSVLRGSGAQEGHREVQPPEHKQWAQSSGSGGSAVLNRGSLSRVPPPFSLGSP